MQKFKFSFLIILFSSSVFLGLKVDTSEIGVKKKVRFVNYKGKYYRPYTMKHTRGIGINLGQRIKKNNRWYRYKLKYSIIHAVDPSQKVKLNADIFSINKEAQALHINGIRAIISGYLEKKYAYSGQDSDLLALYISYYNAVYRRNIRYFSQKFKRIVIRNISRYNAGISLYYYNWPGKSRLIIPLTSDAKKGNLSSLDSSILTDKKVLTKLKTRKDMGLKDRKKMVNLKKRETKLLVKRLDKEKKKIEETRKKIDENKRKIDDKKRQIKKDQEKLKTIKNKKDRDDKKRDIKKKQDQIKKDETKLKKDEKDLHKKEDSIIKKEYTVLKKKDEIKKESKDIKKDETVLKIRKDPLKFQKDLEKKQKDLDKREDELKKKSSGKNVFAGKLYYLKTLGFQPYGHYNNEMYIINTITKKVEVKTSYKNICGRKYSVFSKGVVIIGHPTGQNVIHNMVMLDRNSLKPIKKGIDNIFWRSFVEVRDGKIFAVTIVDNSYYLAKFDDDLKRIQISKQKVFNDTFISFYGGLIYLNSRDKKIMVLKENDLSFVEFIAP